MKNRIKKNKKVYILMFLSIILIIILYLILPFSPNKEENSFRALPRPIGSEPLMITSAGQSTDIYVIKDIANKLMIDNYFMPLATDEEIGEVKSAVIVIGYSEVGIRLNDLIFEKEKERVLRLVKEIKNKNISLVTVYLRGSQMLSKENKELLDIVIDYTDYIIITEEKGDVKYFEELTSIVKIPITIVGDVNEVSEPFVSVFR